MTMFTPIQTVGLDFETWSPVDLAAEGAWNYIMHPDFRVTLISIAGYTSSWIFPILENAALVLPLQNGVPSVEDYYDREELLRAQKLLTSRYVAAHNAEFEQLVLMRLSKDMGMRLASNAWTLIDTAVMARAYGLSGSLDACVQQLREAPSAVMQPLLRKAHTTANLLVKGDKDGALKKLFATGDFPLDKVLDANGQKTKEWKAYCGYGRQDAALTYALAIMLDTPDNEREQQYAAITRAMNINGWPVDMEAVDWMSRTAAENTELQLNNWHKSFDPNKELNFNSTPQLIRWAKKLGFNVRSFKEEAVTKMLDKLVGIKNAPAAWSAQEREMYHLLKTKELLGGSSLKKLDVIRRQVTPEDNRLRGQYLHVGASQTLRTTGKGVQMQNLKRLHAPIDLDLAIHRDGITYDNTQLASNLRQVFATPGECTLLVADFSSIESRGLAYLAGADWKLRAYEAGKDMYKVMAAKIFHTQYELVTSEQRQIGKVGELACGYNAGGPAVRRYAAKMGITLSEAEANELVTDWRTVNPEIVAFWATLHEGLLRAMHHPDAEATITVSQHIAIAVKPSLVPKPGMRDLYVTVTSKEDESFLRTKYTRIFRGCYLVGSRVQYHKPSSAVNGPRWSAESRNPLTQQMQPHSIYGGKLTGILVQSFCRELFMQSLQSVYDLTYVIPQLTLIGQFHDEIVVECTETDPDEVEDLAQNVRNAFLNPKPYATGAKGSLHKECSLKSARRYTK